MGAVASTNPRNPSNWSKTLPAIATRRLGARLGVVLTATVLPSPFIAWGALALTFPEFAVQYAIAYGMLHWLGFWLGAWAGTLFHSYGKEGLRYVAKAAAALFAPAFAYGVIKALVGHDWLGNGTRQADFMLNSGILMLLFSVLLPAWCVRAWRCPLAPIRFRWHAPALLLLFPFANFVRTTDLGPFQQISDRDAPTITQAGPVTKAGESVINGISHVGLNIGLPAPSVRPNCSRIIFSGKLIDEGTGESWSMTVENNSIGCGSTAPSDILPGYKEIDGIPNIARPDAGGIPLTMKESAESPAEAAWETLRGRRLRLVGTLRQYGRFSRPIAGLPGAEGGVARTPSTTYVFGPLAHEDGHIEVKYNSVSLNLAGAAHAEGPTALLIREDLHEYYALWQGGGSGKSSPLLRRYRGAFLRHSTQPLPPGWCDKASLLLIENDVRGVNTPVDVTITLPRE